MAESWQSFWARWGFNLFPAYRGTGGVITYIAADWKELHLKLPLNRHTRNYFGTIYGGSMYGAVNPIHALMLVKNLGSDYIVWDKAATIRFKKPGRSTLYARFVMEEAELAAIKTALQTERSVDRTYLVELTDAERVVHAEVDVTVYVRKNAVLIR